MLEGIFIKLGIAGITALLKGTLIEKAAKSTAEQYPEHDKHDLTKWCGVVKNRAYLLSGIKEGKYKLDSRDIDASGLLDSFILTGDYKGVDATQARENSVNALKHLYEKCVNEILRSDAGLIVIKHQLRTIPKLTVDEMISRGIFSEKKANDLFGNLGTHSLHNQTAPEPNFVGRQETLDKITGWYRDPNIKAGALIAWGGEGKSTIARRWYDMLDDNAIVPQGIFWWGFYNNADLGRFVESLFTFLGGDAVNVKDMWQRVDHIKDALGAGEYLVVLDGLEEMQKGEESGEDFGRMGREMQELLTGLADLKDGKGLCLITTRYPMTDLGKWEGGAYRSDELERLTVDDGLDLFKKVGVTGSDEDKRAVIEDFKGHAQSITLIAYHLVDAMGGDIKEAKKIPSIAANEDAGGKAYRTLLWYDKQLNEGQRAFLKLFSLFRVEVKERDFRGLFQVKMESPVNEPLVDMDEFTFSRMVKNLCDRRLISREMRDEGYVYSAHPNVKGYFESTFGEDEKKLCHRAIYEFIMKDAPKKPMTLDEMAPLFEAVYHGCRARMYQEALDDVYYSRIQRENEAYLVHKLGAWVTALNLVRNFFPDGDLAELPRVTKRSDQSYLLNEAALTLLNTGRPDEAAELFIRKTEMQIEDKEWRNASGGYLNLAGVEFRSGRVKDAIETSRKAIKYTEKMDGSDEKKQMIMLSKVNLAYTLFLSGDVDKDKAGKLFKEAEALVTELTPQAKSLYSLRGVQYADYLMTSGDQQLALETSKNNLVICKEQGWLNIISSCHRSLGAIKRVMATKESIDEAAGHIETALDIARKVGQPALEIEALIERARLRLDADDHNGAAADLEQVIKMVERTTFMLYEPEALVTLAKVRKAQGESEEATNLANSAIELAKPMPYHWPIKEAREFLSQQK